MIDLDVTFFIQLVNFLIVLAVLNPLLIKPIRKIIRERKEAAAALLGESEEFFHSAEDKLTQYEDALAKAREQALAARESLRVQALSTGDEITTKATREAQGHLKAAREQIGAESNTALAALRGEVDPLARRIMDKVTA